MGVMMARAGNPVLDIENEINQYVDLTSELDGITSTFTMPTDFKNPRVFWNGRLQQQCVVGTTATSITLDFIPVTGTGRVLIIFYDL